ncbi:MAG: hypothetical protein H7Y04_13525 [Verrucomicrobia bacterium]|nr:hypothetical protein [Cytophagales bacterium]
MKNLIIPILAVVLLSCANSTAQDTKFSEKIHKEFTVPPNSFLAVYNLEGSVKIEGYAGDKVIIDIDKTIRADNNQDLEEGKRDFKFGFDQKGDSLIIYTAEPYDTRPKIRNQHVNIDYQTHLNYVIKVPNSLNMRLSTINDGDILVENVNGLMKVDNINGAITLKNVKGANDVHTINGDVNVIYTALPPDNAKYYTLNGDLNITYPANFSADCEFKSFQGEFFTDFEEIEKLPAQISKITKENNGSTTHKLSKTDVIRIGKGGKKLHFETFNGNIYIKKKS